MSNAFGLSTPDDFNIFKATESQNPAYEVVEIGVENLIEFENQKFPIRTGQKFLDMVESVKANGVLVPLMVHPADGRQYEIIAGRHRRRAAIEAGMSVVPCIIKEDMSEDDVRVAVYETNIHQSSFMDYPHSVRAAILADHFNALNKQGKRSDLIKGIKEMLSTDAEQEPQEPTYTNEKLGQDYGLSRDKVIRYIKADKLIDGFKKLLDDEVVKLSPAAVISRLKPEEQETLLDCITENRFRITMVYAEQLKALAEKKKLTNDTIIELFQGKKAAKKGRPKAAIQVKRQKIEQYFTQEQTETDIEETILKALEYYFNSKGGENNVPENDQTAV